MEPLASPFTEVLDARTAYTRIVAVEAVRGDQPPVLLQQPSSGQVTQDARRTMRWNGELEIPVPASLAPRVPSDLLTPFGTIVTIRVGLRLPDGSEATVPYGVLSIDESRGRLAPDARSVFLPLVDLSARIAGYRFESPFTVPGGTDLADVVNMVVVDRTGVSPTLPATGSTITKARTFGLDPETDPWAELADLAAAFGYRIWYDRTGRLVLDQTPARAANDAGPYSGALTVDNAFDHHPANVVVARGETTDGSTPVQAVVYDDDPSSPTYAGTGPGSSPYGRVTRFYASPLLSTVSEAALAARSILDREAAAPATWTVTKAFDPVTDPDDVIAVPLDETTTVPLTVDSVTVSVNGSTTLECRAIAEL